MKATKAAWTVILRDLFDSMTSEGVEFRDPEGHLVEAPNDIWALLKANSRVNVQFLDMERGKTLNQIDNDLIKVFNRLSEGREIEANPIGTPIILPLNYAKSSDTVINLRYIRVICSCAATFTAQMVQESGPTIWEGTCEVCKRTTQFMITTKEENGPTKE